MQLGWLHFDDEKQTFVPVRTAKVGGTQEVDIKLSAGQNDIIDFAKAMVFTDNKSTFRPEQSMTFRLAKIQHEDISSINKSVQHLPSIYSTKVHRERQDE